MTELKPSGFLPEAFTEDDWQVIAASLMLSESSRAHELSKAIVGWRIEVSRSRQAFLHAFAAYHHK